MKRTVVVSLATVVLCLCGFVVTQASAATRTLSASGGTLRFTAKVRNATSCHWTLKPPIPSIATTMRCKTGTVSREAKIPANTTTIAKAYTVTLTIRSKTTTIDHWKVTQAADTQSTNTTTTTPDVASINVAMNAVNSNEPLFNMATPGSSAVITATATLRNGTPVDAKLVWSVVDPDPSAPDPVSTGIPGQEKMTIYFPVAGNYNVWVTASYENLSGQGHYFVKVS